VGEGAPISCAEGLSSCKDCFLNIFFIIFLLKSLKVLRD
jgi:hypothetical protein